MEEELAILKSELRSLVVSSATPVAVNRLKREYRDIIGEQLPLAKYGYRDAVSFLRDKCSDCFIMEGSPGNPILIPIVPESLKHIDRMVSRQKLSAKDKSKGRRRSVMECNIQKSPAHDDTESYGRLGLMNELRLKIPLLLKEHREGVWCADLMSLYKKKFGRTLQYQRAGHSSVISLVRKMPNEVIAVRPEPAGDWRLYSSEHPPSASAPAPIPPPPRELSPPESIVDPAEDALPGLPYERGVFPEDCMQPGETVPEPILKNICEQSSIGVFVGELYSPSHLWLLRRGPDLDELDRIMEQMNIHYESEGGGLTLSPAAVRCGHYCAKRYDGDWHRSVIVRLTADRVKVRHVDYGTVEEVAREQLRPLRRVWAQLPAQALKARLSGVRPVAGGSEWPVAAASDMLRLVEGRELIADVLRVDSGACVVEVRLRVGDECVASRLVALGHADREEPCGRGQRPYHFPEFDALERALTLSFSDILKLRQHGVSPYFVDEYTRYLAPAALKPVCASASLARSAPLAPSAPRSSTLSASAPRCPAPSTFRFPTLSPSPPPPRLYPFPHWRHDTPSRSRVRP